MDRNQDVEVELYEENVGNLNYSTNSAESRSSSPDRFLPVLSSQEPTQRRLEEIPFVATIRGPILKNCLMLQLLKCPGYTIVVTIIGCALQNGWKNRDASHDNLQLLEVQCSTPQDRKETETSCE